MNFKHNTNNPSQCQICLIKQVSQLSADKNNNNNINKSKYYSNRHKCYNKRCQQQQQASCDLLSVENQELISLGPPRIDSNNVEQVNSLSLKIILFLGVHFSCIISMIILCCYLEEINSKYSLNLLVFKLTAHYAKYFIYFLYFLMFSFFILIVSAARFRIQSPLHYFMFAAYTLVMSLFYSYLTLYYFTNLFIEFLSIVLLGLILMSLFCSCQRKFSLVNVPYLPYLYTFGSLSLFLAIYCLIKMNLIKSNITLSVFKPKLSIEFLITVLVGFVYTFYIIFDLQFILGDTILVDYDFLTLAFNLLTKDVIQLAFMFNSFVLSSIK